MNPRCELPMSPCHTYCLPLKPAKTMGHYKGKADAFVFLLGIVDPLLAHPFQRLLSQPDRDEIYSPKQLNLGLAPGKTATPQF